MKIKNVNIYKVSLLLQAIAVYLVASGHTGWYIYPVLAGIFVERAVVAFILWMATRMQREMAAKLMEAISQAQASGQPIKAPPFNQDNL